VAVDGVDIENGRVARRAREAVVVLGWIEVVFDGGNRAAGCR
jgi:hypothetical protein